MAATALSTGPVPVCSLRVKNLNRTTPRHLAVAQTTRSTICRAFTVTFIGDDGSKTTGEATSSEYLLDVGERLGVDIPCVCRSGTCASCAVRLTEGSVDYSDLLITTPSLDTLLSEEEIADGLIPSCRSRPVSNVTLQWSAAGLH